MDLEISSALIIPIEMQKKYLERRSTDVGTLYDALVHGTWQDFSRIGHQIKGNASSFGYPELEAIGCELEAAGLGKDEGRAETSLAAFRGWVDASLL